MYRNNSIREEDNDKTIEMEAEFILIERHITYLCWSVREANDKQKS